ncbi:MAG: outer membrane protein assembly factor BamB [Rhodoferax sp.]|nr:outer membrane protein assembly factor BamB [Rhodoferax sp.]MBP9929864.1 outer membrane protein assembly factor BamB [Rhodoferax sp.]HQX60089.1 outer membrane protein assembly factor BamB [Burkholderiaceae bacterium]HQZ06998.1 outer membrane protein assembly factor BamB [Burkholderiaceae bacterium]
MFRVSRARVMGVLLAGAATVLLGACASGPDKPKPTELAPNAALIGVRLAWTSRIGPVNFPLDINVNGNTVTLAGSDGSVAALDGSTGTDQWRASVTGGIAGGIGSDGRISAVVTRGNELLALERGREIWRENLGALSFTAPLVAGERVFAMTADRAVTAFDGRSGRRLWTYTRSGDIPLSVRQYSVMLAVGNTLVVGISGRLVGLDPLTGTLRWESPIATARGTNDVERLVDLVGRVSREGDSVCARAFQTAIGCVNAARGSLVWSKPADGAQGVHGDADFVFGTESDGKVIAWRRADGEKAWTSERLKYRGLTAPLAIGRSVAVGDATGLVHFLSRQDGSLMNRMSTDGSAIAAAPVVVGNTLVVVTEKGGVFGFRPE